MPAWTVLRHGRAYLGRLLLAGLLATLTDLAGLALLATATWLIATAAGQPPITALTVAIVGVRAFALGKGVGRYAERLAGHDAALRLLADLRSRTYAGMAVADRDATVLPVRAPDALNRLVSDVDAVQDLVLRCLIPAGVAALVSAAGVAVAAVLLPAAAVWLATGLVVAAVLLPAVAFSAARRGAGTLGARRAAAVTAAVDTVHGAADLLAFGAHERALATARARTTELARAEQRTGETSALLVGAGVAVPAITALMVALVAIPEVAGGQISGPLAAVLALASLAAVEAVTPLTEAAVRFADLRGALARVSGLVDLSERAPGPPPPGAGPTAGTEPDDSPGQAPGRIPLPARTPASRVPAEVEFAAVVVRYAADRAPALNGIDLRVSAGSRLAVVGPSGSGKSTLLAALSGQVPATSGRVLVGGASPQPDTAWRQVTGVLADAHMFHTTLRENLTLGRRELTDEDLDRALRLAGLEGWTGRLDQLVGEDGAALSGGERQRVLIARALVAPAGAVECAVDDHPVPGVLVLDEPTEGLDAPTADAVLRAVLDASSDRTVILVTHRLVGLDQFDEVVVLDAGRIIQRGSAAALRATPGWFAEEWAAARSAQALAHP